MASSLGKELLGALLLDRSQVSRVKCRSCISWPVQWITFAFPTLSLDSENNFPIRDTKKASNSTLWSKMGDVLQFLREFPPCQGKSAGKCDYREIDVFPEEKILWRALSFESLSHVPIDGRDMRTLTGNLSLSRDFRPRVSILADVLHE